MKYRIGICLAAWLLAAAMAAGAAAETLVCIVPDGQYVNVRNRASSQAAALGMLHAGDTIETDPGEITDGFFKTTFGGKTAYVSVRYFEIGAEERYVVEANGRVRMRNSPGGEAAGFIQPGQSVHVNAFRYAADGSKWARCTGGKYISAEYLRLQQ